MNENMNLSNDLHDGFENIEGDPVSPSNVGIPWDRQTLLNAIYAVSYNRPCNEYANAVLQRLGTPIDNGRLTGVQLMLNWLNSPQGRNTWSELPRDGVTAWNRATQGIPTIAIAPTVTLPNGGVSIAHIAILRPRTTHAHEPFPGFIGIRLANGGDPASAGHDRTLDFVWQRDARHAIRFFTFIGPRFIL